MDEADTKSTGGYLSTNTDIRSTLGYINISELDLPDVIYLENIVLNQ